MAKQILVGLLGTIGSGKTTVSDYLVKKYRFYRIMMGDIVRGVARKLRLDVTRENLTELGAGHIRPYTKKYWIDEAVRIAKKSKKSRVLIDGIRKPIDALIAKRNGAVFILIDAKPEIRYNRIVRRKREDEKQESFSKFKRDEERERKFFNFKKTLGYVDYKIDNSGTVKALHKQVDKLIRKISES